MRKYKITQQLLALALPVLLMVSCTESIMDEINKDKNHPSDVQAKFILADVITATAFNTTGGDFSLYASMYVEHEVGVHNQFFNAETRNGEPNVATTYNNYWSSTYTNIRNAKIAINKCLTDPTEKGNDVTLGIAKLMLAYNGAVLTDLFGDIPFSEAGEINPNGTPAIMQPKIDKQEDVYKAIMQYVDEAIVLFGGTDKGIAGAIEKKDLIYNGDPSLWKKAAYGLKARYTLRLLNKSANKTADLETILDCVSKSFASAEEELKYDVYNGSSITNPLQGITASRDGIGASASLVAKFVDRKDPRANYAFMKITNRDKYIFEQVTDPTNINTAPNGTPQQVQYKYDFSMVCLAPTAPTQLMSYHELLFIKAEALARLNRPDAEDTLKDGITAAFANLENSIKSAIDGNTFSGTVKPTVALGDAVVAAYYDKNVKALFAANPLKEISMQKYLSFFGASGESIEAYADYRRLEAMGEHAIELKNSNNAKKFPQRFGYGADDTSANLAVKAAFGDGQYVYTEKVWWAGGTR